MDCVLDQLWSCLTSTTNTIDIIIIIITAINHISIRIIVVGIIIIIDDITLWQISTTTVFLFCFVFWLLKSV